MAGVTIIVIPTRPSVNELNRWCWTMICFCCVFLNSRRENLAATVSFLMPFIIIWLELFKNDPLFISSTLRTHRECAFAVLTHLQCSVEKNNSQSTCGLFERHRPRIRRNSTGIIWIWIINQHGIQPVVWNPHRSDYQFMFVKAVETIQTAWSRSRSQMHVCRLISDQESVYVSFLLSFPSTGLGSVCRVAQISQRCT